MKKISLMATLFISVLFISCKDNDGKRQDVSSKTKIERKYEKAQDFTYSNWVLKSNDSVRKIFKEKFTPKQLHHGYFSNSR